MSVYEHILLPWCWRMYVWTLITSHVCTYLFSLFSLLVFFFLIYQSCPLGHKNASGHARSKINLSFTISLWFVFLCLHVCGSISSCWVVISSFIFLILFPPNFHYCCFYVLFYFSLFSYIFGYTLVILWCLNVCECVGVLL